MAARDEKHKSTLGFITIEKIDSVGLCGGLLILDIAGRPVEFHCTAPVPPNRAQQILYGKTYESFLYGESIAHALVKKASPSLDLIIINQLNSCSLTHQVDTPVVLVGNESCDAVQERLHRGELEEHGSGLSLHNRSIKLLNDSESPCWLVDGNDKQIESVRKMVTDFLDYCDVEEPFERIQQAIAEAISSAAA